MNSFCTALCDTVGCAVPINVSFGYRPLQCPQPTETSLGEMGDGFGSDGDFFVECSAFATYAAVVSV